MSRTIKFRKLFNLPQDCEFKHATEGSAGIDLFAAIQFNYYLQPSQRNLIPTGIIVELPDGMEGQVRPRSGLALNYGITILNSPGTIDSDYRGEIGVILMNLSDKEFIITPGMKIAQMVFAKYQKVEFQEVESFLETERGTGGFGSTGY